MGAWLEAARRWRAAKAAFNTAAQELENTPEHQTLEECREELLVARDQLVAQGSGSGEGVVVKVTTRRGAVDWKSAAAAAYDPALHGGSFDGWADEYRRPGSQSVSVREVDA